MPTFKELADGLLSQLIFTKAKERAAELEAENKGLRAALEKISNGEGRYGAQAFEYKQIARAALKGGE